MRRHPVLAIAAAAAVGAIAVPLASAVLRSPRDFLRTAHSLITRLGPRTGLSETASVVGRLRDAVLG